MIWDLLNYMISVGTSTLDALETTLLPASPLYLSAADVTAVSGVVGYAAFWLPVSAMSATLALFITGVVGWVTFLLVKQFIEAVIP